MALFKKKPDQPKQSKARSLHEIVDERVLTAEGWRRRIPEQSTLKKKSKSKK